MNLMAAHDACGFPSKIVENSPKPVEPIQIESDRGPSQPRFATKRSYLLLVLCGVTEKCGDVIYVVML
jgi:hypothetical protein